MIPLRDAIPSRTTPCITVTIIVLNALAWLFELTLPHEQLNDFLTLYGVLPAVVLLGFWFLMQIFSAGTIAMTATTHGSGGVAFAAHVAGFVMGLIGVFVFKKPERDRWASADYDRWA